MNAKRRPGSYRVTCRRTSAASHRCRFRYVSRGRLWAALTVDYPNELNPPAKGRDKIVICEDTDGDGRGDKVTVFAEGLS